MTSLRAFGINPSNYEPHVNDMMSYTETRKNTKDSRADFSFTLNGQTVICDPTHRAVLDGTIKHQAEERYSAHLSEQDKINKYKEHHTFHPDRFYGVAGDIYGAMGPRLVQLTTIAYNNYKELSLDKSGYKLKYVKQFFSLTMCKILHVYANVGRYGTKSEDVNPARTTNKTNLETSKSPKQQRSLPPPPIKNVTVNITPPSAIVDKAMTHSANADVSMPSMNQMETSTMTATISSADSSSSTSSCVVNSSFSNVV